MKRLKKNKGITLIALIITIIVMLILVGVTVNVALNGGLFKKAQEAAEKTQIEMDREVLQAGILAALDKDLRINTAENLQNNLPEGWSVTGSDEVEYKATSPNNNIFPVDDDGTIHDPLVARNSTELERYIFGEEGLGRDLFADGVFSEDIEFAENSLGITSITNSNWIEYEGYISFNHSIKYQDEIYEIKIIADNENGTVKADLVKGAELIYKEKGREGEIVKYDSDNDGTEEDWMILYNNGTSLELVSVNCMGDGLTLGTKDLEPEKVGDMDKNGIPDTEIDRAIYSYNNAINRLNTYCDSLIKNETAESVRCLGSNPNIDDNKVQVYDSKFLRQYTPLASNMGKKADENYKKDMIMLCCYGDLNADEEYWLASRDIWDGNPGDLYGAFFGVRYFSLSYEEVKHCTLWEAIEGKIYHIEDSGGEIAGHTKYVRPVVKVSNCVV